MKKEEIKNIFYLSALSLVFFETIPEIVIQCINNEKIGHWSEIAIASIIFSVLSIIVHLLLLTIKENVENGLI